MNNLRIAIAKWLLPRGYKVTTLLDSKKLGNLLRAQRGTPWRRKARHIIQNWENTNNA